MLCNEFHSHGCIYGGEILVTTTKDRANLCNEEVVSVTREFPIFLTSIRPSLIKICNWFVISIQLYVKNVTKIQWMLVVKKVMLKRKQKNYLP